MTVHSGRGCAHSLRTLAVAMHSPGVLRPCTLAMCYHHVLRPCPCIPVQVQQLMQGQLAVAMHSATGEPMDATSLQTQVSGAKAKT